MSLQLFPVTKIDNENTATPKTFDNDVMSENFDVIVNFPIHGQFRSILSPDSRHMACKT